MIHEKPFFSEIWFWQLIISPHMAELAGALAQQGYSVVCVAGRPMSKERSSQGWLPPHLSGVTIHWASHDGLIEKLVGSVRKDSVHFCQGVRANGIVGVAQKALAARGLSQWAVMETVEDSGWRGLIKRIVYRHLFWKKRKMLSGVLGIGYRTSEWVISRGFSPNRVFPFAYFLSDRTSREEAIPPASRPEAFKFVFVGRLIPLKRVDWLIKALAELKEYPFELWIVGAGEEESKLSRLAEDKLGKRVRWLGQLPMAKVPSIVAQADCLVLPSIHDGWGAVCSEALMVGTPVVCSDACGAAGVVEASGHGGVFLRHNIASLRQQLALQLEAGRISSAHRSLIVEWARSLGAAAGAVYLLKILKESMRPSPPWQRDDAIRSIGK